MTLIRSPLAVALVLVGCHGSAPSSLSPPVADSSVSMGQLGAQVMEAYRKQVVHASPLSFVPSDGGELALVSLTADVTIEGPLAHTELHLAFRNPDKRQREGRFSIALPPDAAVGRFAMKTGEVWREARVVSRAKGRQVYEQFLRHGIDPALVEQDAGNQFSARVFPIAPESDKELIFAYDAHVSASDPYVLSLRGLPAVPALSVAITQDGARRSFARSGEVPDDLVVAISPAADAVASGSGFVARVDPVPGELAAAPLDRVLLLVDTSASRAPIMALQADVVRRLAAALPSTATLAVAVFDQGVTEVYRGPARDAAPASDAILSHGALGASDLGAALAYAESAGMRRVVLIGDGLPTLGESDPAMLAALVKTSRIARVDAVRLGQTMDRDVVDPIVAAGREPGAVLDGRDVARAVRQLASALPAERAIRVTGALETWPATTRGIAAGDPVWVFGRRAPGAATAPLAIQIGERAQTITPRLADEAHVTRAVARAQIAALSEQVALAPADAGRLRAQIETIALAHHLVSSETSLLVLESDALEQRLLGPLPDSSPEVALAGTPAPATDVKGETIVVHDRGPVVDPTSTTQGITLDRDYTRNIPVGRTMSATLGGSTSLDDAEAAGVDPSYIVQRLAHDAAEAHRPPPAAPSEPPEPAYAAPYAGQLATVMDALAHGDRDRALDLATRWHLAQPGDVSAIIAFGEALEARGANALAARAYGSLIDLYPGRAEMDRAAGERLDRIPGARALAIDAYRRAIHESAEQASSYRLLAYDLMREQRVEALDVIAAGKEHATRASVRQMLEEDAGIIGAELLIHAPAERAAILARWHGAYPTRTTLRFVLSWETDANDVDLHVRDRHGDHAFYQHPSLPSGGTLREDITDGFGPEMFEIDDPSAFPYRVGAHYYSRGPMGVGLGSIQIIRVDGPGHVTIEDRPFVIQNDHAMVELGTVDRVR